jgi:hypothetical protein
MDGRRSDRLTPDYSTPETDVWLLHVDTDSAPKGGIGNRPEPAADCGQSRSGGARRIASTANGRALTDIEQGCGRWPLASR